jgi:hypothetical protein
MRRFAAVVALLALISLPAEASWKKKLWQASLVALAAGSAADAHSSWGLRETNPFLRGADGRFNHRGLGLKIGLAGGVAVTQYLLMRRVERQHGPQALERNYLYLGLGNLASGAAFGAVAARNYGLTRAR